MIARMSHVEIIGPKGLLSDFLALIHETGVLEIEQRGAEATREDVLRAARPSLLDEKEKALYERLFLQDLRSKVDSLLSALPSLPVRESYLRPEAILSTIAHTVDKHLNACRELDARKAALQAELAELKRYAVFLYGIDALFRESRTPVGDEVIGLTLKDADAAERVKAIVAKLTQDRYRFFTVPSDDGTLTGLITVERAIADEVSQALSKERVPEHALPPPFADLPLSGKLDYLESKAARIRDDMDAVEEERRTLCLRWAPLYTDVRSWVVERLALLDATAAVYETAMCFCLYGWMPSREVEPLRTRLSVSFGDRIVLTEKALRERDLERAPVTLSNPVYFKPFEIFTRLLPVPAYGSFDPTPFFGIFFPLFFGMILGDVGYGIVLIVLAAVLLRRFRRNETPAAALKVLIVCSVYTMIFGVLYGEYFGDLGHRLLGLEPIWMERRTGIIPMLYFAVAVGVAHILLGLFVGVITSFRKKARREAVSRLLNVSLLLCLVLAIGSSFGLFPGLFTRPAVIVMLFLMPILFFAGGLLAPLEVLKSIGNMVSYVRIMAIGLTSVMLAYVANSLAGQMGNLLVGIVFALLLHALNMVLGVFAPTVHALRLHYVEFFTKFFEPGGRRFEPFRRSRSTAAEEQPPPPAPGSLPSRAGAAGTKPLHGSTKVPAPRRAA